VKHNIYILLNAFSATVRFLQFCWAAQKLFELIANHSESQSFWVVLISCTLCYLCCYGWHDSFICMQHDSEWLANDSESQSFWVMLQCVAVCCRVLQCVAVCCSVLQCVAVCCSVLMIVRVNHSESYRVATISRPLKLEVFFAEYSLCHRALLQKRPIIQRSPLIVATPYWFDVLFAIHVVMCDMTHSFVCNVTLICRIATLSQLLWCPEKEQLLLIEKRKYFDKRNQNSHWGKQNKNRIVSVDVLIVLWSGYDY